MIAKTEIREAQERAWIATRTGEGRSDMGGWAQTQGIEWEDGLFGWAFDYATHPEIDATAREAIDADELGATIGRLLMVGFATGWTAALLHGNPEDRR